MELPKDVYPPTPAACSPDTRFLAVAQHTVITIYDLKTRRVQAKSIGHEDKIGTLHFAPINRSADIERTTSVKEATDATSNAKYLLCVASDRSSEDDERIVLWELDDEGRPLTKTAPPLEAEALADRAMGAISADLAEHHGFNPEETRSIRTRIIEALQIIDSKNRMKHLRSFSGSLTGFRTDPISHDCGQLLYEAHRETTQHSMRPPDELPQIAVVNLSNNTEVRRLKGHTDAIM